MTPKDVTLKFSKIFVLVEVLRKGYKKRGIWARIKRWVTTEKLLPSLMMQSQALQQTHNKANSVGTDQF